MSITSFLQQEFHRFCPEDWQCSHESRILHTNLEQLLGYAPRVDVLLEKNDGLQRLWIEFEISRADPVANHAKFATAHLFEPQRKTDIFVSMISAHVKRGRHNLAANTIELMRRIGMNAFQTTLFPRVPGEQIYRLNHASISELSQAKLDVQSELSRVLSIAQPLITTSNRNIHLAGNIMDVMLNLRRWNLDIVTQRGLAMWKRRTVTYFVVDPQTGDFAPCKFCAYVSIPFHSQQDWPTTRSEMTIDFYAQVDATHPLFDGKRAWTHLVNNLGMDIVDLDHTPQLTSMFGKWLTKNKDSIIIHPAGPKFLLTPKWFS